MNKLISEDMIINQIIKDFPATVKPFSEFGIDSCCGGQLPLKEAASRHDIPIETILKKLNDVAK